MPENNNHAQTDSEFLRDILMGVTRYSPENIERLLLPMYHGELRKVLQEVRNRIERRGQEIQTRRTLTWVSVHTLINDRPLTDKEPLVDETPGIAEKGDITLEEQDYLRELYKRLTPERQNIPQKFFWELCKEKIGWLPTTIDGWILWWVWGPDIIIRQLEILCEGISTGDANTAKFKVIDTIIPELKKNPQFLEKDSIDIYFNPPHGCLVIRNILDIYKYMGAASADLISPIMRRIQNQMWAEQIRPKPIITTGSTTTSANIGHARANALGTKSPQQTGVQKSWSIQSPTNPSTPQKSAKWPENTTKISPTHERIYSSFQESWVARIRHLKKDPQDFPVPGINLLVFDTVVPVRASQEYWTSLPKGISSANRKIIEDAFSRFNDEFDE